MEPKSICIFLVHFGSGAKRKPDPIKTLENVNDMYWYDVIEEIKVSLISPIKEIIFNECEKLLESLKSKKGGQ